MKQRGCIVILLIVNILCLTICVAQIPSQTKLVSKPVQNVWYQSSTFSVWPLSHDDANTSLYLAQPYAKTKADLLVSFDNEDMAFSTSKVQFADKRYYSFVSFAGSDGRKRLLYIHDDAAPKVCYVHLDVLNPDIEQNKLVTDAAICSFEYEITYDIKFVQSPDKDHFALLIYHQDYEDNISKIHAMVFDQNGNMEWENDIVPDIEEQYFRVYDYCLDNKETLYMPFLSINKDKDEKNITEQYLHLIRVDEDGMEMNRVEMDYGYAEHVMAKPTKDGNVILCGFYKEGLDELSTETGMFIYTFNPNTQEFISEFHHGFGTDYFAKYPKTDRSVPHPVRPWHRLVCKYIFETENGEIVICGEHVSRVMKFSVDYGYYTYRTGDILVVRYTPGRSATVQIVPKNQNGISRTKPSDWKDVFVSFSAFVRHNDLYLIYNEAVDNIPYPGKGESVSISPWGANNKYASVCTKIAKNGTVSQQTLVKYVDDFHLYRDFLFADDNYYYVSLIQRNGIRFAKYPLP